MSGNSLQERLRTPAGMAVVLAAVALASVALYLPATHYGFVWDDGPLITDNSLLASSRPADLFSRGFWAGSPEQVAGPSASYYRPLVTLSFWLGLRISHANPHWFHLVNLLLYALTTALITLVLWELLNSGVWALLGGLLFAVHPSHVESVAFVSGRTDIMLTFFTAIAAFALLRSFREHNRWWWLVVPPALGLALLSKETAALLPLLVALAPLLVGVRYDRRYWLLVLATLAVLAGYIWLRSTAVPLPTPGEHDTGIWSPFVTIVNTFGLYIRMFFWPFEHHVWYKATATPSVSPTNVVAFLLFVVSALTVALKRRFAKALWGYAWTVASLLPVVIIASLGPLAAERLLFLPSAGIVMILVMVLSRLVKSRAPTRRVTWAGFAVVIVLFGIDSMMRTRVWRNAETLFPAMIREAPDVPGGYSDLADAIVERQPDSALALYQQALRLDPDYVHAHLHAALLFRSKGAQDQAIEHLLAASRLVPNSQMILNNLALAYRAVGENDSALTTIDRALALPPGGSPTLHLNRASILISAGRSDEAARELHRTLALDSTLSGTRTMLADLLRQRGRYDSAIILMQSEARSQPSAQNFSYLGDLFISVDDSARAGQSYSEALRLDPAYVPALYHQSVLCAAQGDSATARMLAERAYRLRPGNTSVRELYLRLARLSSP